jgi:hypothetical protein
MFNEKEREQVNRYLSNETFICSVPFFSTDGSIEYEVEYSFKVVGERRMISVGEYFMYAEVDLEILDIEEKYKLYFTIMGKDFDKDRLVRIFFEKEYSFTNWIRECVGENLKYFTDGDYPRVNIKNITMSDELYENIMNKKTEDTV